MENVVRIGAGRFVPSDIITKTSEEYNFFDDGTFLFIGKIGDYPESVFERDERRENGEVHMLDTIRGYKNWIAENGINRNNDLLAAIMLILEDTGKV